MRCGRALIAEPAFDLPARVCWIHAICLSQRFVSQTHPVPGGFRSGTCWVGTIVSFGGGTRIVASPIRRPDGVAVFENETVSASGG